jgi:hypothetical protein
MIATTTPVAAPAPLVWYYLPVGNLLVRIPEKGVTLTEGAAMYYNDIRNTQQIAVDYHSVGFLRKWAGNSAAHKVAVPIDLAEKLNRYISNSSYMDYLGVCVELSVSVEIVEWVKAGCLLERAQM